MVNYTSQVATIHRKFNAQLKKAKSRQDVLSIYWKHKAEHENLLQKHLKEELIQINKIKSKIAYK